jgi:hypothetical protein
MATNPNPGTPIGGTGVALAPVQAPIPTDVGLLALLRAVSSDATIRDRFRTPATFNAVLDQFQITDQPTRLLIAQLGVTDVANLTGVKTVPDKAIYLQLLEKLYDQQLGQNAHFTFMW